MLILFFSARLGGGEAPLAWHESRSTGRCFSSLLSYCQNSGVPPPQSNGRGSNMRNFWRPSPPMVANHRQPANH